MKAYTPETANVDTLERVIPDMAASYQSYQWSKNNTLQDTFTSNYKINSSRNYIGGWGSQGNQKTISFRREESTDNGVDNKMEVWNMKLSFELLKNKIDHLNSKAWPKDFEKDFQRDVCKRDWEFVDLRNKYKLSPWSPLVGYSREATETKGDESKRNDAINEDRTTDSYLSDLADDLVSAFDLDNQLQEADAETNEMNTWINIIKDSAEKVQEEIKKIEEENSSNKDKQNASEKNEKSEISWWNKIESNPDPTEVLNDKDQKCSKDKQQHDREEEEEEDNDEIFAEIIQKAKENEQSSLTTPFKQKPRKTVTFSDEKKVIIHFNENDKITNLSIFDSNGNPSFYTPVKWSNYTNNLKSPHKPKSILLNSPAVNVENIIQKANKEVHEENEKLIALDKWTELIGESELEKKRTQPMDKTEIVQRNLDMIKEITEYKKRGLNYPRTKKQKPHTPKPVCLCQKFKNNPQRFFTEHVCDTVLKSMDIEVKSNKKKKNTKKSQRAETPTTPDRNTSKFSYTDDSISNNKTMVNIKKYFEENAISQNYMSDNSS